jgi:hypothetical protein
VPAHLAPPANTKSKTLQQLSFANIVQQESILSQQQLPAEVARMGSTNIKIMLRRPLANLVLQESIFIYQKVNVFKTFVLVPMAFQPVAQHVQRTILRIRKCLKVNVELV